MKKVIKIIFSIFLCSMFVYAGDEGTSGFTFLKMPLGSARIQGLGGNGVSSMSGMDAMNINPAGVGFSQMREIGFSAMSWFEDYKGKYISYIEPRGTNVIGVNAGYFSVDGFESIDEYGNEYDGSDIKFSNMFASIILAKSFFMERFALGFGAKYVMETRDLGSVSYKNSKIVYDWGSVLRITKWLSFGFSQQNITGDNKKIVGVRRYGVNLSLSNYLTIIYDNRKFTDTKAKNGYGFEITLPEEVLQYGRVVFRAGYVEGNDYGKNIESSFLDKLGLSKSSGWSFGIGLYSAQSLGKVFSFDYAFTPYGELGKTSQFSFGFKF